MDSKQAQVVMTEIIEVLENSALSKYSPVSIKGEGTKYYVFLTAFVGAATKQEIYTIALKRNLSITEGKEGIKIE